MDVDRCLALGCLVGGVVCALLLPCCSDAIVDLPSDAAGRGVPEQRSPDGPHEHHSRSDGVNRVESRDDVVAVVADPLVRVSREDLRTALLELSAGRQEIVDLVAAVEREDWLAARTRVIGSIGVADRRSLVLQLAAYLMHVACRSGDAMELMCDSYVRLSPVKRGTFVQAFVETARTESWDEVAQALSKLETSEDLKAAWLHLSNRERTDKLHIVVPGYVMHLGGASPVRAEDPLEGLNR